MEHVPPLNYSKVLFRPSLGLPSVWHQLLTSTMPGTIQYLYMWELCVQLFISGMGWRDWKLSSQNWLSLNGLAGTSPRPWQTSPRPWRTSTRSCQFLNLFKTGEFWLHPTISLSFLYLPLLQVLNLTSAPPPLSGSLPSKLSTLPPPPSRSFPPPPSWLSPPPSSPSPPPPPSPSSPQEMTPTRPLLFPHHLRSKEVAWTPPVAALPLVKMAPSWNSERKLTRPVREWSLSICCI